MKRDTALIFLAVTEPLKIEKTLGSDDRFAVVGSCARGDRALREASKCDCAVLDMHAPGVDAFAVLDAWRRELAAPPRVLLRCPYQDAAWERRAFQAGADRVTGMETDAAFPELLWETVRLPLPALSAPYAPIRRRIAEGLIDRLGVSPDMKGREYMIQAAAALCCAPQLGRSMGGRLYPYLAKTCGTTPGAAERAIRTAIESAWLTGNLEGIGALFGFSVDADKGKPTNAECLLMLGEHARREMSRYLLNGGEK